MSQPEHDHTKFHNWRILWWAVWCIAGAGSVVIAFYMGVLGRVNAPLREFLSGYPFYLPEDAFSPSPLSVFVFTIAVTLFLVQALLYTYGFFKRLFLWMFALLVVALTVPVCAMWDVYFSTSSVVVSLAVAGLGAVVTPLFLKSLRAPQAEIVSGRRDERS